MIKFLQNRQKRWNSYATLLLGVCGSMNTFAQSSNAKPNVLFLLTDDQTYKSIHALNNSEIITPNLDKLKNRGVVFTHAFNQGSWSAAICVASRTMIITGQTVFHAAKNKEYLGHGDKKNQTVSSAALWGETMGKAGYNTFITGKWHNSSQALLRSFERGEAIGKGMYASTKNVYNRSSVKQSKWSPSDKNNLGHWSPSVYDIVEDNKGNRNKSKPYIVQKHTSELYTEKAISYLRNEVPKSDKPFFMYVAFNAPHDPRQSPQYVIDKYPLDKMQIPVNFLPEHPFDQGDHKVRDEKLAPFPRTLDAVALHRQEYYAMITHVDEQIGKILDALEKSGKADNTYIIFTSDHGLAVGCHGLMGKQNQYEHSIRMPLIICGPNIPGNKRVDEMVYMQSVFATTCDFANINTPNSVEFPSLKKLIDDKTSKGEKYIFGAYKNLQRMVRSKHYKLIVYPKSKHVQLFDIKRDPQEMFNLSDDKEMKRIKKQLFKVLCQKQKELDDFMHLSKEVLEWN